MREVGPSWRPGASVRRPGSGGVLPARPRPALTLAAPPVLAGLLTLAAAAPAASPPAPPVHATVNVVVNHRAPADVVQDVQSPSIAVNPRDARNLVIASRSDTPDFGCQIQVSTDGGASWTPSSFPPPPRTTCWAPAAAFDDANHAYVVTQNRPKNGGSPQDIIVWASSDGGRTFAAPVTVPGSTGDQAFSVQPGIAVDTTRTKHPGGPAIYVTWYAGPRFPTSNEVFVSYSADGGATWSTPIFRAVPGEHQLLPTPAVGPEGNLYVVYKDTQNFQQTAPLDPSCPGGRASAARLGLPSVCPIRVLRSTDGGRTFDSTGPNGAAGFQAGIARYDASKPFDLAAGEAPGIAVAANGDVLVTYASLPDGAPAPGCTRDLDAFAVRSSDAGATWGAPIRMNDDPCSGGASQLDPWISTAADGRVDAMFYDNRNDPDHVLMDVYYTSSTDGGRTFGPNRRLTDRSFDATVMFTPKTAGFQATEYDRNNGIVSTLGGAVAAWGDARNTLPESRSGDPANTASDVFAAAVALGPSDLDRPARLGGGADPVDSAVNLSRQTFSFAPGVVIAAANDTAGALAAAPLARQTRGPVLLVPPGASLPPPVRDEIARLNPASATLVGGTDAVSPAVSTELSALGVGTQQRLEGPTRYATAARVAEQVAGGKATAAVVASADDASVALVAAAFAAAERMPLLFTARDTVPQETLGALQHAGVTRTVVVGGTDHVAESVIRSLDSQHLGPVRVGGATRYRTAADLAGSGTTFAALALPLNVVYVASGRGHVTDALAAPAVIAYRGGTLLLGDGDATSAAFVRSHRASVDQVMVVGPTASLRLQARSAGGATGAALGAVATAVVVVLVVATLIVLRRRRAPTAT